MEAGSPPLEKRPLEERAPLQEKPAMEARAPLEERPPVEESPELEESPRLEDVPSWDQEPPGQAGPGLAPREGVDPTLVAAALFVMVGFTPVGWWEGLLGVGHFGPIQLPAVVAMVGVLFGFIAILRSVDLQDLRLRWMAGIVLAAGLVRLFVLPLGA